MLSTDKLHDSMTPFMYHIFTIQTFHSLQKEKTIPFLAVWGTKSRTNLISLEMRHEKLSEIINTHFT